jgi:Protein of unknown function (DUF3352)
MVAAGSIPTLPRLMRRLASAVALLLSGVAIAGCGEDDAGSALDQVLGYLPSGAPFAVAIDTDVEGGQYQALDRIASKFPFGAQARESLRDSIEGEEGIDFERDVRPLLGNPFVVGAPSARSVSGGGDDFVGAIQVRDQAKLEEVVKKNRGREVGERGGATIYRDSDGDTYAVDEDVLIVANERRTLESALDTGDGGEGLTEDDFNGALEGLPGEALVRLYADIEALLDADPSTSSAQRVKWVNGLRTLGLTGVVRDDGLDIEYRLRTEDVSEADLPIAPGDDSPGVVRRRGEVAVGIRDLRRIVDFGEAAAQAVNPDDFRDYEAGKEQLDGLLGVNIDNDLFAQLTGETAFSVAPDGAVTVRAELEDPEAFEQTLGRVADVLPRVAGSLGSGEFGLVKPRGDQDLYRLTDSNGRNWFFGVVDEVFVLAPRPAAAEELASATPESVSGARGSVVSSADAEELARAAVEGFGTRFGLGDDFDLGRFIRPLGETNSWVSASTDELRGRTTLEID